MPSSDIDLQLKVLPIFPARVEATDGITVVKENGTYRFGLDFLGIGQVSSIDAEDRDNIFFLGQNDETGEFSRVSFALPEPSSDL